MKLNSMAHDIHTSTVMVLSENTTYYINKAIVAPLLRLGKHMIF